jgi:hypothetical protein
LEFGKSANEGREADHGFRNRTKSRAIPVERCFHGKIKEADARAGLKTHAPNNLSVSGTRLILQEEIIFEYGKIRRNPKEGFTKMDKDLEDGVRVKMD